MKDSLEKKLNKKKNTQRKPVSFEAIGRASYSKRQKGMFTYPENIPWMRRV